MCINKCLIMEIKYKLMAIFMLSHSYNAAVTFDKSNLNLTDIPRQNIPADTEILTLNYNHIENTAAEDFLGLTGLTELNVNNNQLSAFLNLTHVGSTLRKLDLSYNFITEVFMQSLLVLTSLKNLHLGSNQIAIVPDFSPLANSLTNLFIGFNNMTGWKVDSLSHLTNLKQLYAQDTNLDVFPNLTASTTSLQSLSMGMNNIAAIPEELFFCLNNLQTVHLHQNKLKGIPKNIGDSTMKIRSLHLQKNRLTEFPALEDFGAYLKYIDVSVNDIEQIYSEKFQLADRMTTEPLTIKMTDNKINTIPPLIGNFLQYGIVFDLSDNVNLVCDGNIAWVVSVQQGTSVSGQCKEPVSLELRELSMLTYDDLANIEAGQKMRTKEFGQLKTNFYNLAMLIEGFWVGSKIECVVKCASTFGCVCFNYCEGMGRSDDNCYVSSPKYGSIHYNLPVCNNGWVYYTVNA